VPRNQIGALQAQARFIVGLLHGWLRTVEQLPTTASSVFAFPHSEREGFVRAKRSDIGLIMALLVTLPQFVPAADNPKPESPPAAAEPTVTVIDGAAVRGILGRTVQGADGKEMGRIVDIMADPAGQVRAAIIDFGGFLGVGSRKIAVNWNALHFAGAVKNRDDIKLEATRDQLKAAPEYREGNPVVVIGSTGALEPLDFPPATTPEK
jgi:PRC-barrel domain